VPDFISSDEDTRSYGSQDDCVKETDVVRSNNARCRNETLLFHPQAKRTADETAPSVKPNGTGMSEMAAGWLRHETHDPCVNHGQHGDEEQSEDANRSASHSARRDDEFDGMGRDRGCSVHRCVR
jgi:hypothetical protein